MIEVVVAKLGVDPGTQSYVIVLQEKGGERLLPIWIGQPEAESIVIHMQKSSQNTKLPRPLTHDLCQGIIRGMGARLRRVQITRVENNTYFGELHLEHEGKIIQIDSRPSDAIAVALRMDAPIFAAEGLLMVQEDSDDDQTPDAEGHGPIEFPQQLSEAADLEAEELKRYLEHLRPEDFGKFNL